MFPTIIQVELIFKVNQISCAQLAVVPSFSSYIANLLNGKIGICGDLQICRLDVNNDQCRVGSVFLKELVDFEIRGTQLGSAVIPSNHALLGYVEQIIRVRYPFATSFTFNLQ